MVVALPNGLDGFQFGVTNKLQTGMIFRVEALNSGSGITVICPDISQHGNPSDKK